MKTQQSMQAKVMQVKIRVRLQRPKLNQKATQILTCISLNTFRRVQEINTWEQLELENLELFDPVAQKHDRLHPIMIRAQSKAWLRHPPAAAENRQHTARSTGRAMNKTFPCLLEQDRIDTQAELEQQHRQMNKQVDQSGSQKKIFKQKNKIRCWARTQSRPDGGCQTETGSFALRNQGQEETNKAQSSAQQWGKGQQQKWGGRQQNQRRTGALERATLNWIEKWSKSSNPLSNSRIHGPAEAA
jgi:hypothetical protein